MTRQEITQRLLDSRPTCGITLEQAMRTWWVNQRASGGLRLTDQGYSAFLEIMELKEYVIPVGDAGINTAFLLKMNKRLTSPYYIVIRKRVAREVVLFLDSDALLAYLYGDINSFVDSL